MEGLGDNIDAPLCEGIYKGKEKSVVTCSGTDQDSNMNYFTWSKDDKYWVVPGYQYNGVFKN